MATSRTVLGPLCWLTPVAVVAAAAASYGCGSSASDVPRLADAASHDARPTRDGTFVDARRDDSSGERHEAGAPDAHRADSAPHDARDGSREDAGHDAGGCHATPLAADYVRKVVVSRPFDSAGNASPDFEVFELDTAGQLTEPDVHFTLGSTSMGTIAFTPDGMVGLVAEDDGTLGVFRFDETGAPKVVAASLSGSYYADGVVMDPSGARAYVLDDQTANNGGGVYVVAIACDGSLTDMGLLAPADLPAAILTLGGGSAVVAAKQLRGVPQLLDGGAVDAGADAHEADAGGATGNDAVLVPWPAASSVTSVANPFGDELAIVSSAALTKDGRYVLLGDNSQFSGVPNRVGVVRVSAGSLVGAGVVPNVNDPEAIVASPFDDTLLVTSAFGNALYAIEASADAGGIPFVLRGELTYQGGAPQLPGPAVMISRGSLLGRVLVAEDIAIRQEQFASGGVVTDLGPTAAGDPNDLTSITGAIGVQP